MSKRERLAAILDAFFAIELLERLPQKHQLVILNFHRIGDPQACPFDRETFSTTLGGLELLLRALKSRYNFVGVEEAEALISNRAKTTGTSLFVTFDDGYVDNLDTVPLLKSLGLEACFFLVTSYTNGLHN